MSKTSSAITATSTTDLAPLDLLDFAVPAKARGQKYPVLQTSTYRPAMDSKIKWVLNPDSVDLLSEAACDALKLKSTICHYGEETEMYEIQANVMFAVIAQPETFTRHKETGEIDILREGVTFRENGLVSIAKLLLVPVVDGVPILDDGGVPQIVTLKLTSTRMSLIQSQDSKAETLATLNRDLCAKVGKKGIWLLHLCGIDIKPVPRKVASAADPKLSSVAVCFDLGALQLLDCEHLPGLAALAQSQDVIDYNANPFGIKSLRKSEVIEPEIVVYSDDNLREDRIDYFNPDANVVNPPF